MSNLKRLKEDSTFLPMAKGKITVCGHCMMLYDFLKTLEEQNGIDCTFAIKQVDAIKEKAIRMDLGLLARQQTMSKNNIEIDYQKNKNKIKFKIIKTLHNLYD